MKAVTSGIGKFISKSFHEFSLLPGVHGEHSCKPNHLTLTLYPKGRIEASYSDLITVKARIKVGGSVLIVFCASFVTLVSTELSYVVTPAPFFESSSASLLKIDQVEDAQYIP